MSVGSHTSLLVTTALKLWVTLPTSSDVSFDARAQMRRAAVAMARLSKGLWDVMLSIKNKINVYEVCVLGTLIYGSESLQLVLLPRRQTFLHLAHS